MMNDLSAPLGTSAIAAQTEALALVDKAEAATLS